MWISLKRNLGKVMGGLVGLLIALLLIFAWPLVLIIFLVVMGIFLGGIFDVVRRTGDFFDRIFPRERSPKDEDGTG
jgi:uncharacterized membrane protein